MRTAPAPICINHGCNKPCTYSKRTGKVGEAVNVRYRPFCDPCYRAGRGLQPYAHGVTPWKKNVCANADGKLLGFMCPTDFTKIPEKFRLSGIIEIDHIDGDHLNNKLENLQELCKVCHHIKTQQCGDNIASKKRVYAHEIEGVGLQMISRPVIYTPIDAWMTEMSV
jgi:5-methylcytosine-specific restriction endonuclease McrA